MNTDDAHCEMDKLSKRPCAFFWDESLLWGVMAWLALKEAGLPFDLLRSEDIRAGMLSHYRMVFVPGGWASNKICALKVQGMEEIRRFVAGGGSYLGICGGAGMATEKGLDLLPIKRKSPRDRVPSFSGPIRLSLADHAIWKGIQRPVFCLWWPSQFQVEGREVKILAEYEEAQAEAFSSDINVADGGRIGWSDLEQRYGIHLNPDRLRGEPGVVEGSFGQGRVILSLAHFDTPGDLNGTAVLRNLWGYLASCHFSGPLKKEENKQEWFVPDIRPVVFESFGQIKRIVDELIALGIRNYLWSWRNPMILQWRRGIRGMEYSTLAVMTGEIAKRLGASCSNSRPTFAESSVSWQWEEHVKDIREQLIPFCEQAKELLLRERFYMMGAPLSPMECTDREINRLRRELFGSAMSNGGRFKRLIEHVDRLLYHLIKEQ